MLEKMEEVVMKNIIKTTVLNLSLSIVVIAIAGCAETNNREQVNIKTPYQSNAFISGSVNGDKYVAMDKSFTINLPYKEGTREYDLMEIDEFYYEKGASVVFGEIGKNNNIFNLEIVKFNNENSFDEESVKLLTKYSNDLYRNYRSKPRILKKHRMQINGYNTIYWTLLQKVAPKNVPGLNYGLVNHQVFAINLNKKIAFLWVQKTAKKDNNQNNIVSAFDFAASLTVPNNNNDMKLLSSLE